MFRRQEMDVSSRIPEEICQLKSGAAGSIPARKIDQRLHPRIGKGLVVGLIGASRGTMRFCMQQCGLIEPSKIAIDRRQ